jgi:hypothetical protein
MNGLVGVWKLIEVRAFDETGQAVPSHFGPQPMGVAIFDAQRVMAMGGDGRMALSPDTKRAFVAYGGKCSFDGAKLVTCVDGASSPDLLEDQVRHIRFDGPRRMTAIPISRLFGQSGGVELVWERVD